jgi:hypothetical protein
MRLAAVVLLCALAVGEGLTGEAGAQEFSRAQAARGREQFSAHCATCHSERQAASLMAERGAGQTLGEYHAKLSQIMPPLSTLKPSPQSYLDIIAMLSSLNVWPGRSAVRRRRLAQCAHDAACCRGRHAAHGSCDGVDSLSR